MIVVQEPWKKSYVLDKVKQSITKHALKGRFTNDNNIIEKEFLEFISMNLSPNAREDVIQTCIYAGAAEFYRQERV